MFPTETNQNQIAATKVEAHIFNVDNASVGECRVERANEESLGVDFESETVELNPKSYGSASTGSRRVCFHPSPPLIVDSAITLESSRFPDRPQRRGKYCFLLDESLHSIG